jgi:uncharacterized protein (TIRG00374 family)
MKSVLKKVDLWSCIKLMLALGLIALLLTRLKAQDLLRMFNQMNITCLPLSVFLFVVILWMLARRSWFLLRYVIPFGTMVKIVTLQTGLTNLVSTLVGTASYLAALKLDHHVQLRQSVAAILLARLGDLIVLLPVITITSALVWEHIVILRPLVSFLSLCLALLCLFAILLLLKTPRVAQLLQSFLRALGVEQTKIGLSVMNALDELAKMEPRELRHDFLLLLKYSASILVLSLLMAWINFQLFGLSASIAAIFFVNVLSILFSYVPIQILGGLGVYEVTAVFLFGLFGVNEAESVPIVLTLRLYFYLLNGLVLLYPVADALRPKRIGTDLPS